MSGEPTLTGHRREADHDLGLGARLEDGGLGDWTDIVRDDEGAEGATTFGMGLTLRDPFPIEVGHLLNEVEVVQDDRAVGPDGERVLLAGDRDAGIGRGRWPVGFLSVHMAPLVRIGVVVERPRLGGITWFDVFKHCRLGAVSSGPGSLSSDALNRTPEARVPH